MNKFKLMFLDETSGDLIDVSYRFFVVMKDEIESGWEYHSDAVDARIDLIDTLADNLRPKIKKLSDLTIEQLTKFCQCNGYQLHVIM